jgi:nucleoside-diphosphate-sugar epimerase
MKDCPGDPFAMARHDQTYVITGATGFLGSHLMAALLKKGRRVLVLGRSSDGIQIGERIKELVDWFHIGDLSSRVKAFEVNILEPQLGLDRRTYRELCAKRPVIIHCASDTRFSEHNRALSLDTNVRGLSGIIELAKDCVSPFFHYVSTAYVAGHSSSVSYETPVTNHVFSNVYEETKALAEKEVARRCAAYGIPYTITRPSIVYGDSTTGRSNRFNALYYHVRSLKVIRDIYLADIREHAGIKSHALGIHCDNNGTLRLPLRIMLGNPGRVNLIPVDHFTAVMGRILEKGTPGTIYNITDDNPRDTGELAAYTARFLNIQAIEVVYGNSTNGTVLNPAEELFNRLIEPYRPYLSDRRCFDRSNTLKVTGGIDAPGMTYEIFERCMNYAIRAEWGKAVPGMRRGA